MLRFQIPGTGELRLEHLVLDFNGTLAVDGALGIAVILSEGAAGDALRVADVVCNGIGDALDLLLADRRLVATLRV